MHLIIESWIFVVSNMHSIHVLLSARPFYSSIFSFFPLFLEILFHLHSSICFLAFLISSLLLPFIISIVVLPFVLSFTLLQVILYWRWQNFFVVLGIEIHCSCFVRVTLRKNSRQFGSIACLSNSRTMCTKRSQMISPRKKLNAKTVKNTWKMFSSNQILWCKCVLLSLFLF